ncbi:MAG TPA: DNA-directed RNA polymerase subunit epsilon [Chondromyces sp.]|nr:DNA-directed RNA polymerase subunit epsilon [Chondromyces sp.]
MIFKVYYQQDKSEVPVREHTKTMYVEADSGREVREKLKNRPFNIEYVQLIEGAYLEYERQNEDYKVENL